MAYICYENDGERCSYKLSDTREILFGRSETSDFELPDSSVSRQHFLIYKNSTGEFIVRDLNSSNGTFVNGELLHGESKVLSDKDEIRVSFYKFLFAVSPDADETIEVTSADIIKNENANVGDQDIETLKFSRPGIAAQSDIPKNPRGATKVEDTLCLTRASNVEIWEDKIRNYVKTECKGNHEFCCSYDFLSKICDSFPVSGQVLAAKLKSRNFMTELKSEYRDSGEFYPSGKPRKIQMIIWKVNKL